MDAIVVLCTVTSPEEGQKIATSLIAQEIAACVQISHSPVQSLYRWKGKIEESSEYQLWIKTRAAHFEKVSSSIRSLHSYDTPEVIALPVNAGLESYLGWLYDVTSDAKR